MGWPAVTGIHAGAAATRLFGGEGGGLPGGGAAFGGRLGPEDAEGVGGADDAGVGGGDFGGGEALGWGPGLAGVGGGGGEDGAAVFGVGVVDGGDLAVGAGGEVGVPGFGVVAELMR